MMACVSSAASSSSIRSSADHSSLRSSGRVILRLSAFVLIARLSVSFTADAPLLELDWCWVCRPPGDADKNSENDEAHLTLLRCKGRREIAVFEIAVITARIFDGRLQRGPFFVAVPLPTMIDIDGKPRL